MTAEKETRTPNTGLAQCGMTEVLRLLVLATQNKKLKAA